MSNEKSLIHNYFCKSRRRLTGRCLPLNSQRFFSTGMQMQMFMMYCNSNNWNLSVKTGRSARSKEASGVSVSQLMLDVFFFCGRGSVTLVNLVIPFKLLWPS